MRLFDFIFFARPMLLIPVWTVFLHYLAFRTEGRFISFYINRAHLLELAALTLIFAGVYVLNQIFDIESDRANDKLYFLPRGIITTGSAWWYYVLLSVAGLAAAGAAGFNILLIGGAVVVLGILYSVPKIKLKDRPYWGLISNGMAYGILIPVMANFGREFSVAAIIPYFLAIATGYVLTTIPDREGDRAAGKKTVAVIFGINGALWWGAGLSLAALVAALISHNMELAAISGVTLLWVIYLLISFQTATIMLACKLPIMFLTVAAGIHFPCYLPLLLLTILLTRFYYKRRFGIIYPKLS